MNELSDVIMFVITTVVVMLFIQAYRFATFVKRVEDKDYYTPIAMVVTIFNPPTKSIGVFKYYVALLSGSYLSACKREYPVEKEIPGGDNEEGTRAIEKELYLIREFFYPEIVVRFLIAAGDVSEFRSAVEGFLREIYVEKDAENKHPYIARIDELVYEFAEEENMTRAELLDMMSSYLSSMDEAFIKRKIKESNP